MTCSISSTMSSAYFTVRITCPHIFKSPKPSRASLERYSLYKLNRIGDEQHPCLIPRPVCTSLFSPWSSFIWTLGPMYDLMINLPSCQSIPVPFTISINWVQFTRSNAFCQSMKHAHISCSMSKVRSQHFKCILISFSSSTSKLIFSK
jgi:hypothetical protein